MWAVIFIIAFFWTPGLFVIARNLLWDTYFWQVKEYRFDRMISHILNQEEDFKQSFPVYLLKVTSLVLLLSYLFIQNDFLLWIIALVFGIYVFETLLNLQTLIGQRLIKPKISIRNFIITLLSISLSLIPMIIGVYFIYSVYQDAGFAGSIRENIDTSVAPKEFSDLAPFENNGVSTFPAPTLALLFSAISIVIVDLLTPVIVSIFVLLTEPYAQIRRWMIIKKAQQKVSEMKNLKIIGITGSFGKTSTKEILYQLLKKNFKVEKTPKNYNSAVGIAISVLNNLKKDTEIFLAEMGAYTKNEVRKATDVVKPDISIVTGIDNQHLSLFGSKENIMLSKFEIIQNAKDNSLAILNGDNEFALRMAGMTDKNVLTYFTAKNDSRVMFTDGILKKGNVEYPADTSIYAHSIEKKKEGIEFKIKKDDKNYSIQTNIKNEHNVSNLMAAILAALSLGVDIKEIVEIINTTDFELPYLNQKNGLNNTTILDDGYNANATGFISALKELAKIEKPNESNRKYIMTKGIIELGWEKKKEYERIAKEIITSADGLITTDRKLIYAVQKQKPEFTIIRANDEIKAFIKGFFKLTNQGDIVLIEGPLHKKILNEIIDKN
ncbi:MAG TPA: UDP-N-acetylmuramoyl-tripeptide--D-alanyl-D-alanine ligase [Candidatus Dojkabacteria bacterium]|jgi:UDP-N-acetylmuramoyl-tripeptide--D-alanyl-D-alanine ligase